PLNHHIAATATAAGAAPISSHREAVFCQSSRANGRHTIRTETGKTTAPVYCNARAYDNEGDGASTPGARSRIRVNPPQLHRMPAIAKKMLARGVPENRAARKVSTRSTAVISSEVV